MTPTGVTAPVAGESTAITMMSAYIAIPLVLHLQTNDAAAKTSPIDLRQMSAEKAASFLGQCRPNRSAVKPTLVRCWSNSDQSATASVCPLRANNGHRSLRNGLVNGDRAARLRVWNRALRRCARGCGDLTTLSKSSMIHEVVCKMTCEVGGTGAQLVP